MFHYRRFKTIIILLNYAIDLNRFKIILDLFQKYLQDAVQRGQHAMDLLKDFPNIQPHMLFLFLSAMIWSRS